MGIEPTYPAWKAGVLPLNYTRMLLRRLKVLLIIAYSARLCQVVFPNFPGSRGKKSLRNILFLLVQRHGVVDGVFPRVVVLPQWGILIRQLAAHQVKQQRLVADQQLRVDKGGGRKLQVDHRFARAHIPRDHRGDVVAFKAVDIMSGAAIIIVLRRGAGVHPDDVRIDGVGAGDAVGGHIKKGVANTVVHIVPCGVKVVVAAVDGDQVPHMRLVFLVDAGHQRTFDTGTLQQILHTARISLAYRLTVHQCPHRGERVRVSGNIVRFARLGVITARRQHPVMQRTLHRKIIAGGQVFQHLFPRLLQLFGGFAPLFGGGVKRQADRPANQRAGFVVAVSLVIIVVAQKEELRIIPGERLIQLLGVFFAFQIPGQRHPHTGKHLFGAVHGVAGILFIHRDAGIGIAVVHHRLVQRGVTFAQRLAQPFVAPFVLVFGGVPRRSGIAFVRRGCGRNLTGEEHLTAAAKHRDARRHGDQPFFQPVFLPFAEIPAPLPGTGHVENAGLFPKE